MITMDLLDVLRNVLGSYRVQILRVNSGSSSADLSTLDYRLRDQLYEGYDYTAMAADMVSRVPQNNVIDYRDEFGLHYLVFRGPENEGGDYLVGGPYLYRNYSAQDFERMIAVHHLGNDALNAIQWYFKRVPVIHDNLGWRQMLSGFLSRYLANPDLDILSVRSDRPNENRHKPVVDVKVVAYDTVEARYAVEEAMLDAIRRGDIGEATHQQNLFMGFSLDARNPDPLREAKNMIITVNTLYRKAIQQASVHPAYIDAVSGQFHVEIEAAETLAEVNALIPKMIRHYCLLVKRHSLERYSSMIRDCINYISFHYKESLSLEILADRFSINKNYLSSRFHKEVEMTITDFINRTRIDHAMSKLAKTTLSIQEIAEQCGFADGNYFTRTFRKLNGMTPNEYRISLKRNT